MKIFKIKDKEKYYSSSDIDKTNCTYRMIIGQRANGKTYNACKKIVTEFLKNGKASAYIRRYAEDIQPKNLATLFSPHADLIKKLSKEKYNSVVYRSNTFKFAKIDKDGKTIATSDPFCYTAALSNWERQKGSDRGEISYIIFDEFMTRSNFLTNEFTTFCNVLSTFIRNRDGVIVYMLANTVNKYCPYFEEMGLTEVMDQKQGTIAVYSYNNDKLTVAVEYCLEAEATQDVQYYYAFDNENLDMIKKGSWEEDSYPHLDQGYHVQEEDILFKFLCVFHNINIIGKVIRRQNDLFLYFHKEGNSNYTWTDHDIVYTTEPTTKQLWKHSFYDGDTPHHLLIKNLLGENKVYVSTNSVGEVIRNFIFNEEEVFGRY